MVNARILDFCGIFTSLIFPGLTTPHSRRTAPPRFARPPMSTSIFHSLMPSRAAGTPAFGDTHLIGGRRFCRPMLRGPLTPSCGLGLVHAERFFVHEIPSHRVGTRAAPHAHVTEF